MKFKLHSKFKPAGGQPKAIKQLIEGYSKFPIQTLQGITGSGKSLDYNEIIFYKENGLIKKCKIGEFVEKNLNDFKIIKDTKYSGIEKNKKILSFDSKTGEIREKFITQVSKHKEKTIFEILFDDNSSIKVTKNHNFYKLNKLNFDLVETNDLNIGDIIPLTTFLPKSQNDLKLIKLDFDKNLNLNIKNLLLKLNKDQIIQVLNIFRKYYKAYNWKYRCILNSSKERGIKVKIFLEIIEKLDLDLNKIKKYIFFVNRKGEDKLPFIIDLDKEFINFLGLYVAEGHSRKDGYIISNSQKHLQKLSLDIAKKLRINSYKRNENDIFFYSSIFSYFLTKYFGNLAYKKKIPSFIFNLESKKIGLFLQGLFDGDGWVEENSLHLSSVSKRLIEDVRYLLLLFGIISRMSIKIKNDKKYYQVNISGKNNLILFRKNIDFSISYKKEKLNLSIKDNENTNVDLIPNAGFLLKKIRRKYNLYQKDLAEILSCEQSYISMLENNSRDISKKLFKKLIFWLEKEKKEDIDFYKNLIKFNLRKIKKIKEIESSNGYVYDIAVEDNETFLAGNGGIFVHNTFVMANVIENVQKPTLVLAHNKTLAAQLYQELKEFFPENKVEYFISYYDYYQPESYIPTSDTYIDKEATVNEEIEKMRLRTISSLMSRNDVIVIASISCIYGAGNPEDFKAMSFEIKVGDEISRTSLLNKFVEMQYSRNDVDLDSGNFRVRGDVIDISPPYIDEVIRIEMFGDEIENIFVLDKVTGERKDSSKLINNIEDDEDEINSKEKLKFSEDILEKEKIRFTPSKGELDKIRIFPSKQFVVEEEKMENAIEQIKTELKQRAQELNLVEEQRLRQRVKYDIEMMQEVGYCTGIENYSRYFDNRKPGTPPHVLLNYFGDDFLFIIDESHQTIPQAHAMYKGDYSRKKNLIDFGFRLPSAYDNRPLKFEEFEKYFKHTIFVSATPSDYELEHSGQMVEQIIRPTGLLDPIIEVRKSTGQVKNLLEEIRKTVKNGDRVLVTTLTKRMAEDLTDYFAKEQIKVRYMHSDIDSLDRIELVRQLRAGEFDVLVGINLLREGLDIPEVSLVAILDADKEGFLRNERSLIQTIGRAARNSEGKVIMYADKETMSMKKAIQITKYRRQVQEKFNKENGIVPKTILKKIEDKTREIKSKKHISKTDLQKEILNVESDMKKAAEKLDFELAIKLRDRLEELKKEV